jgi:hypothetical protein
LQPIQPYSFSAFVRFGVRHVEEFRSCSSETTAMGISDSYLIHLVTIMQQQSLYHPRLPAPLPSNVLGEPATVEATSASPSLDLSVPLGAVGAPGPSEPPASPPHHLVDVHA